MYQQTIYEEAIQRIRKRRDDAQEEQERRRKQIRKEIPEAAELDRQLSSACMQLFNAGNHKTVEEIAWQCQEADRMLKQILSAHGYPADYLDTHYSCPLCDDTGFHGAKPCTCLEREIGAIGAERINRHSRLELCTFENFSMDFYNDLPAEQLEAMQKIYNQCRSYAEEFEPGRSQNILMIGNTGLGKTHLTLSIASVLLQKGCAVIYDSIGNLMHILEQEHFSTEKAETDTMAVLQECDLLIMDDFGTEFQTAFTRSAIYNIINGRCNSGKPMIINTNLTMAAIQSQYDNRIVSRLSSSIYMQFYGRDIRLQKGIRRYSG